MATPLPRRKHPRLAADVYADPANACSVTVTTLGRRLLFAENDLAGTLCSLLLERARAAEVKLYAYCLMPDHMHLLLSPSRSTSIPRFLQDFKSRSTRVAWSLGIAGRIWQSSFYDHFLRAEEDLQVAAQYILNNPVRASLVEDWRHYRYSGSNVYDLR